VLHHGHSREFPFLIMHAHERKSASAQTADIPQQLSEVREVHKPGSRRAIDRLAKEGALVTDVSAQQSCTAGRSSFILGEHLRACGGSTSVLICGG
jgi:arylsulfatase A-like enzyme